MFPFSAPPAPASVSDAASDADRRAAAADMTVPPESRTYDPDFTAYAVPVNLGSCIISGEDDDMLVSILGSCICACVRDPVAGIGGMNHFMLPRQPPIGLAGNSFALRYGHFAMEKLINAILSRGGRKDRLEIKLFGGASLLHVRTQIGDENIAFIRHYLQAEGLAAASEDMGGLYPRRVHYFPRTGKVFRLLMRRSDDARVFSDEMTWRDHLHQDEVEGSISLF